MKDHEIRETINELRDIAIKYHDSQQLRQRIAGVILPMVKKIREEPLENFKGLLRTLDDQARKNDA